MKDNEMFCRGIVTLQAIVIGDKVLYNMWICNEESNIFRNYRIKDTIGQMAGKLKTEIRSYSSR